MVDLRIASARLFWNPDSYMVLSSSLKATIYAKQTFHSLTLVVLCRAFVAECPNCMIG
jgi:hypothetical protein